MTFSLLIWSEISFAGPWTCEAQLISEMSKRLKKENLKIRDWACYLEEEERIQKKKKNEKPMKLSLSKRVFGYAHVLSPYILGASLAIDAAIDSASKKLGSWKTFNNKREVVKKDYCSDPKKRDRLYKKVKYHRDFRKLKKIHQILSLMMDVRGPWKRYEREANGKIKMRVAGTREVPVMNYPCGGKTFWEFSSYRNTGYQLYMNESQSCHKAVPLFSELKGLIKNDGSIFCKSSWKNLIRHFHKKRENKRATYKAIKKWRK